MLMSRRFREYLQLQAAAQNKPPLGPGLQGSGVAALQDLLVDLGYKLPISFSKSRKADSIFGAETERAVRAFQASAGLKADGLAGKQTLTKLDQIVLNNPSLDSPDPSLTTIDRLSDRTKPLHARRNADW